MSTKNGPSYSVYVHTHWVVKREISTRLFSYLTEMSEGHRKDAIAAEIFTLALVRYECPLAT